MKKAIAALLAVSATLSIGVSAFADDLSVRDSGPITSSSSEESSSEGSSSSEESSSSDVESTSEPTAIVFEADEDGIVLGTDLLEPGKEYKFPVKLTIDGANVALTEAHLDVYKISLSHVSGNRMKTFKIEESRDGYYLHVETKDTVPTEELDSKYRVKVTKKDGYDEVFTQEVKFSYGYSEMDGDYVSGLDKGDIVEIDQDYPVITDTQFNKIAKINDYRNVTLAGPEWQFTVNVTDESTKNMLSTNAGIKEVLAKFPDQDFKFFSFSGKPSFAATGKMALDVEDIMDEFDQMYTYRYANGRIYRIKATFNEEDNTLEFRTNRLDNFFVTNKLIKDGTIVSDVENEDTSSEDESENTNTDKNNPGTGASDMINAAVMAAIASLTAAGAVAVKKAYK